MFVALLIGVSLIITDTDVPFVVRISPDLNVPISFIDEPVVVAVEGPSSATFQVTVTIQDSQGREQIETKTFKASTGGNGQYWFTIPEMTPERGFYYCVGEVIYEDKKAEFKIPFCRVDRTVKPEVIVPVVVHNPDVYGVFLAHLFNAEGVCFDSELEDLDKRIDSASTLGVNVFLIFNIDKYPSSIDSFEHLLEKYGDSVKCIQVEGNFTIDHLMKFIEIKERLKKRIRIKPALCRYEQLSEVLSLYQAGKFCEFGWYGHAENLNEIARVRDCILANSTEGVRVSLRLSEKMFADFEGEQMQRIWLYKGLGFSPIIIPYSSLYKTVIQPLYSQIYGSNRFWVDQWERIGWYVNTNLQKAFVFQNGSTWLMVFWGKGDITLTGDGVSTIQYFDSNGNPVALPQVSNNTLTISCKGEVQYLMGTVFPVLSSSAMQRIRELSNELLGDEFEGIRSTTVAEAIRVISNNPKDPQVRSHMLVLLRELPKIEETRMLLTKHAPTITLFISKLCEFLRMVVITEQSRGEPFREPAVDILTRTEEYINNYVTGSSVRSVSSFRSDWLLNEIHRLIGCAEKLNTVGRRIEAVGLAYLAEARAQSLSIISTVDKNVVESSRETPQPIMFAKVKAQEISREVTSTPTPPETSTGTTTKKEEQTILSKPIIHTVKKGETIASICKLYGITEDEFCSWNKVRKGASLKAGKKYEIRVTRKTEPSKPTSVPMGTESESLPSDVYIVQAGDYPGLIAKKLGVTTKDLLEINNLTEKSVLQIGQKLKIPAKISQETKDFTSGQVSGTQQQVDLAMSSFTQGVKSNKTTTNEVKEEERKVQTDQVQQDPLSSGETYKIQPGDNPSTIAKKVGISIEELMKFNQIKDPKKLQIGQELRIPPKKVETPSQELSQRVESQPAETKSEKIESSTTLRNNESTKKDDKEQIVDKEGEITHIVKEGDSPYTIAKKYGVSVESVLKANKLSPKSILHIGQKLVIPSDKVETHIDEPKQTERKTTDTENITPQGKLIIHTVSKGDNPYTIAKKYKVKLEDFLRWNNLKHDSVLQIGEQYKVYVK